MEFWLAIAVFLLPLVGFRPPRSCDGWVVYRDRAILVASVPLLIWLLLHYPAFGIIFALLAWHHHTYGELQKLLWWTGFNLWTFILAWWILIQSLPASRVTILVVGLVLAGVVQCCFAVVDAVVFWNYRLRGQKGVGVIGSLGNRTYLGAYLAILLPLVAVADLWYLFLFFLLGIFLTHSRGAYIAALSGLLISWPMSVPILIMALILVYVSCWQLIPTSSIFQSMGRIKVWMLAAYQVGKWPYWLVGYGFGRWSERATRNTLRYSDKESFAHVHNDWLQLFYEYGILGILALSILIWTMLPQLTLDRSLTGCVVSLGVVSLFTFPHHVGPVAITALTVVALAAKGVL